MTYRIFHLIKFNFLLSSNIQSRIFQLAILLTISFATVYAADYEGFTQPYHKAELSPAETGVVSNILVKEGEVVSKDSLLLELDIDVLKASLKIAEAKKNSKGKLNSAKARHRLHQSQLKKLVALESQGHAQPEEIEQARANASVAKADVLAAEEELLVHKYEFERLEQQIKRRQLFSPFDGIVTRINKELYELTGSDKEALVTVVQLNPLLIVIHVSLEDANKLSIGDEIMSNCQDNNLVLSSNVEYISPVTNPDSGTVRVKLMVDNTDTKHPSGVKCIVSI